MKAYRRTLILILICFLTVLAVRAINYHHPKYSYPYTYTGVLRGYHDERYAFTLEDWQIEYVVTKLDNDYETEGRAYYFRNEEITDLPGRILEDNSWFPGQHTYAGAFQFDFIGEDNSFLDEYLLMHVMLDFGAIDVIWIDGVYDPSSGCLRDEDGNIISFYLPNDAFVPEDNDLGLNDALCKIKAYKSGEDYDRYDKLEFSGRIRASRDNKLIF